MSAATELERLAAHVFLVRQQIDEARLHGHDRLCSDLAIEMNGLMQQIADLGRMAANRFGIKRP